MDCPNSGMELYGAIHHMEERSENGLRKHFTRIKKTTIIMTNADMIRSMSDEELAVNLMCPNEMGMAYIPCDKSDQCNCCKCLLDWLRQSAMEEAR